MATVAGIVASLVGPAIELGKCIVAPIKRQFSYLCCFNSHIMNLREEAKKLEDARAGLQMQVDMAEMNAQVIVPGVQTWLESVDNEILVNMNEIEIEIPKVQRGCLTIISRFLLSKKAKETADAMKELRESCSKFDHISLPAPAAAMVSIPLRPTYEFESRKQTEEDIMEDLRGKKVNIIGIWGMGGVGKTTMAKRIMIRGMEERLFDGAVITVVGQQLDMLKIQREISESLGLKLEVETLFSRAHQLRVRLKGTKRILIVVDDIWKIFKLEDLGIPCESGVEGNCMILFTSRDKGVLNAMEAQKVYAIQTLSEREAWFLFTEKSGICSDDSYLLSIAQDIAKECRGLPIALVTVGSALKDEKDKRVWEGALQQLKDANPVDMPRVLEEVYNPVKLSYDSLGSQHARSLFLLCCLFPEDFDISLEYLTLYCMGLHIFRGTRNLEQVRNRVFMVIEMLKSRFLLLDGFPKYHYVRMHDVVRDVAIFIASKEGLVDVNLDTRGHNSNGECKWISFFPQPGNELPNTAWLNFPSLCILMMHFLSPENLEIRDFSFLEGMKELSVLSFKNISFKSIPQTMQLLKNLRALHLEFCTLETISVVGQLSSLEILCCRYCDCIEELPIEIGQLNRLKLLEFSDCENLDTIPPEVLSNLIELEELTMVLSFNRWELAKAKERESKNVNVSLHELQSLPNLMRLNIEIEDSNFAAEEIHFSSKIIKYNIHLGEWLYSHNKRTLEKKMRLNLPRGITLGNWIHTFVASTEELHLSGDGSNKLDLLQAPDVKLLYFKSCSTVKKLVDTTSIYDGRTFGVFKVLEHLYLINLPMLEEICDVPSAQESNSFKNLAELNLVDLPALEHLWNNPNKNISLSKLSSINIKRCSLCSLAIVANNLLQLKDLEIDSCSMIKQVFFLNKSDGKNSHITFLQLRSLKLCYLESLTTFCQGVGSIEFPMLTEIGIQNCRRLTSLVDSSIKNIDQNSGSSHLFCSQENPFCIFPALEYLGLSDLPNLEEISNGPIPQGSNSFKNLKKIEISCLPALKHLWKNPNQNVSLSNLRAIEIGACDNLRNLFPVEMAMESQLEKLEIRFCGMMEEVFVNEEITSQITFPIMEKLVLQKLKNLTIFSKGIESIEFPALTEMEIVDCAELLSLVSTPVRNPQNSANSNDDDSVNLFYNVTFGRLKKLKIGGCNNISNLWCRQIPDGFFIGLGRLDIVECDSIRSLFSSAIARNLVNLENLIIKGCKEMVTVIEDKEEIIRQTNCPLLLFPRLQEMRLEYLPKLGSFCERRCNIELPMLEYLWICGCPMMEVFTTGSLVSTPKSKHFEFPELTSVASPVSPDDHDDDTLHLFCSQKVTFGGLNNLIIGGYNNISNLWCHQISYGFFIGLDRLEIVDCDRIRSLFSSAIARNLANLKYLSIERWKEMVKVIEDEVEEIIWETSCPLLSLFPRLEYLGLDSLSKLGNFCEWRCDIELPMLEHLVIAGCPTMKVFTMGSLISTPKLKYIEIEDQIKGVGDLNEAIRVYREEEEI